MKDRLIENKKQINRFKKGKKLCLIGQKKYSEIRMRKS